MSLEEECARTEKAIEIADEEYVPRGTDTEIMAVYHPTPIRKNAKQKPVTPPARPPTAQLSAKRKTAAITPAPGSRYLAKLRGQKPAPQRRTIRVDKLDENWVDKKRALRLQLQERAAKAAAAAAAAATTAKPPTPPTPKPAPQQTDHTVHPDRNLAHLPRRRITLPSGEQVDVPVGVKRYRTTTISGRWNVYLHKDTGALLKANRQRKPLLKLIISSFKYLRYSSKTPEFYSPKKGGSATSPSPRIQIHAAHPSATHTTQKTRKRAPPPTRRRAAEKSSRVGSRRLEHKTSRSSREESVGSRGRLVVHRSRVR